MVLNAKMTDPKYLCKKLDFSSYQQLGTSGSDIKFCCRRNKRSVNLPVTSLTETIFLCCSSFQVVKSLIFVLGSVQSLILELGILFEHSNQCFYVPAIEDVITYICRYVRMCVILLDRLRFCNR